MASEVGVMDNPPKVVQRSSRGICAETRLAVAMTSSNGMTWSKPDRAMFAQESALAAAMTFFPRHGASTRLAMGSQIKPIMLCMAMEAAAQACRVSPPDRVTSAAAAMEAAEPPSA